MILKNRSEGKRWAEEPGPLKLVSVDAGGGPVVLRPDVSTGHHCGGGEICY